MQNEIDAILGLLGSDDGFTEAANRVEEWGRASRVADFVALAQALEAKSGRRENGLADLVEDHLALVPGGKGLTAFLALSARPRTQKRARALASRLGYAQSADDFLSTLAKARDGDAHRELLACWMHEVVLRGTSLARDVRATRFHEQLANEGHALGSMPLDMLDVEREARTYLPLYGEKGIGEAMEALESGPMSAHTVPPPADGAAVRATRIADQKLEGLLLSAVKPWSEGPKGRTEAKAFAIDPPADHAGSWLVRALPLSSVQGVARLEVAGTPAEGAFGALFAAGSNGGASSAGLGGAYGRRAAWTSFAALAGANEGASLGEVTDVAAKCTFLSFRSAGPWFHDVAWDLGVLCLRADRKSVAVLAATDDE